VEPITAVLALALLLVVAIAVVRLLFDVVTVHDFERGLRYTRGHLTGLLDAGVYTTFRPLSSIRVFDVRPAYVPIEGQEILTSDGANVRVSLVARYVVGDPAAAVNADQDFRRAVYVALQLGLRDALAGRSLDEVLASRAELGTRIFESTAAPLAKIGIELLSVAVRDVMVPAELKRAFAGVIAARKDGAIALERARGETAALRNLANAARMVEDNPSLLQLRLLQQIGDSSGNTVVVGMAEAPLTVRRARRTAAGAPGSNDDDSEHA
jgi:regulator of protease activity HflC (stomatin/prohibitin superfamily)